MTNSRGFSRHFNNSVNRALSHPLSPSIKHSIDDHKLYCTFINIKYEKKAGLTAKPGSFSNQTQYLLDGAIITDF